MVNYAYMLTSAEINKRRRALGRVAQELTAAACPLRKTATQAVPGEGNPAAALFFIGEAPGRQEDNTG